MSHSFHLVSRGRPGPGGTPRGAELHVILGMTGFGKSVYIANCLAQHRALGLGPSLAIDKMCSDPPGPDHIAGWADVWCREPPDVLPSAGGRRVTAVACDEVWAYVGQKKSENPLMRELVNIGRHLGVSLYYGTQRARHIHPDVWSQAKRVVMFRTMDQRDLECIAQLPGMGDKALLAQIAQLPVGYAAVWDAFEGIHRPYVREWAP